MMEFAVQKYNNKENCANFHKESLHREIVLQRDVTVEAEVATDNLKLVVA